ncbi:citrate synthase [Egicoccus sp. AB-alg2]|uniref:citrate synthase n=1 Tax=Egicoccus sp. AB-alg2 TaxID=3242693 RepID=UPI00359E47E1
MVDTWLDTAEAARRLGVKAPTLYAYVSRGQLRRRTAADGRRSEYHPGDVATLAVRGRRARPTRPSDVIVPTALTAITPDGPAYRGRLARDLAGTTTFEALAAHLWDVDHVDTWRAPDEVLASVRPLAHPAGDRLEASQVLLAATAAARAADPLGRATDQGEGAPRREVVAATGRALLLAAATAFDGGGSDGPLAERLARWSSAGAGTPEVAHLVEAALILLADHELAASTLAARVAASARCDPYAVVLAGLAVLSGPRHGAASRGLEEALLAVRDGRPPATALAQVRPGSPVGLGFGHPLYPAGDPRGAHLLALLDEQVPAGRLAPLHAVLAVAADRGLPPPNVDAALAGLTLAMDAPVGTGELLFAVARTVGWLAHAMEQYEEPGLLRPKAVYTGPAPSA